MELDRVPLWRGNHVAIKQLVDDFARYLYLPRLRDPSVLIESIRSGLGLLTWEHDSFAFAESYDESGARYRGLQFGRNVNVVGADSPGLLVKPQAVRRQVDIESVAAPASAAGQAAGGTAAISGIKESQVPAAQPGGPRPSLAPARSKRFHGTVTLDATRVGRDASRVADEVITHLAGLVGAQVKVTLEIEADVPAGVPENVVRTVTENSRTLKFKSHGFETE
jgi:hypothetical protein